MQMKSLGALRMNDFVDPGRVWALLDWSFLRPDHIEEDRERFRYLVQQAEDMFAPERTVFAVLEQDHPWWVLELGGYPPENIIQQPFDRGSGAAVLVAARAIEKRDPDAWIRILGHLDSGMPVQLLLEQYRARSPRLYEATRSWVVEGVDGPSNLDTLYPFLDRTDINDILESPAEG